MKTRFEERDESTIIDGKRYQFSKLSKFEKFVIRSIYWRNWRHFVNNKRLSNNQRKYFKIYFLEVHTLFYHTVNKGGSYFKLSRLLRNFLLSKANENLRTVLSSLTPYNLTSFVHGLRSQIEINALLSKFIKDPNYHETHFTLNEDRSRVNELKTTININTLVNGMNSDIIQYKVIYDELSLLLHPNPSAIRFYAQAEGQKTEKGDGVYHPQISPYFYETITHTNTTSEWFGARVWTFLTLIEHFLILFNQLKHEFYLNEFEKDQHQNFAMAEFVSVNKKDILRAVNDAEKNNEDVQEALNKVIDKLRTHKSND